MEKHKRIKYARQQQHKQKKKDAGRNSIGTNLKTERKGKKRQWDMKKKMDTCKRNVREVEQHYDMSRIGARRKE